MTPASLFLLIAAIVLPASVRGQDSASGVCDQAIPPADLSGWRRWSNVAGWGGILPGDGANVTIECGEYVLFDEPAVELSLLMVYGSLMFLDDPSLPLLSLSADNIVVHGNLTIGAPDQHFSQQALITLTATSNSGVPGVTDVGYRTLAAIQGQLNLYGMPGGVSTPSWVSLTSTADVGSTTLSVDQDVSAWPIGALVAIASTDFEGTQTEEAVIMAASGSTLTLDRLLNISHFAPSVPTGIPGISMPMAAEVALLNRNIHITAVVDSGPMEHIGGHVIVYETQAVQTLYGVEFSNMGQQGTLGRYPVHFHMCDSVPDNVVAKNIVHDSLQRCYVVHGTHNMTLVDNVAYKTTGHCFMCEDGIEQNNTFLHNLGIYAAPAEVLISEADTPTDNQPTIFWSATPANHWINNTAVGGDSGYWLEMLPYIRGISAQLPGASSMDPLKMPLGTFFGNTAHSNQRFGMRLYTHGYFPTENATFVNFNAYKNGEMAMVLHGSETSFVDGAMIADSRMGVDFNEQSFNAVTNSIFISQSDNYGNPINCTGQFVACEPISGVWPDGEDWNTLPAAPGPGYRTVSYDYKGTDEVAAYGINLASNVASNNTFVNFNTTCHPGGAVGIDDRQPGALPANAVISKSTMINVGNNRVYIDPTLGPMTDQYWVALDADGTTTGSSGPMSIAALNSSALVPPAANASCTPHQTWNALLCKNVCYRSFLLAYNDPSALSYLQLTRTSDQMLSTFGGPPSGQTQRRFFINILAGYSYEVEVMGSGYMPSTISYGYTDVISPAVPACLETASLNFPSGMTVTAF